MFSEDCRSRDADVFYQRYLSLVFVCDCSVGFKRHLTCRTHPVTEY